MTAAGPPPSEAPSPGGEDADERFGPLWLRRLTKDDGRSLILYGVAVEPDRDDE